jgi:hypothetical protein
MAVHSPLNAFSFDISLIEIGQEIKLLEHFKKSLDHPVYSVKFHLKIPAKKLISTIQSFYHVNPYGPR